MAKKVFTDQSLETFVSEIKSYVDEKVSTKANSSHTHSISNITNLQTQLDSKASSGHTHSDIVTTGDNRSVATTPNSYNNKLIFQGLKQNSTIGSPSGDNYSYVLGLRGWSDKSGGNAHELAFTNSGIFTRNGADTSWGSWSRIYTSANKPTPADIGAAASSHNHSATNITSGTLSSDRLPTIPISKGGTGATTAAGVLTNIGVTATASELNKLDGITATTTELNYVDGVTSNIQTQLNNKASSSHTHSYLPLSGGTISSSSFGQFNITRSGSTNGSAIGFSNSNGVLGYIGMTGSANGGLIRYSADTNSSYTVLDSNNYTAYAAKSSHNHAASNITSGTLSSDRLPTIPISKGGTGATTAAGALTNLGLSATATELNYVDGVTSNIQTQLNGKAASSHSHSYVPLAGGTMTGRLTASGKITLPSTAGSWISGATSGTPSIQISTQQTTNSYHPYFGVKTSGGHTVNIGGLGDGFGFYGYKSGRTENGTDWSFTFNSSTGAVSSVGQITAPKFIGALQGNATTATTANSLSGITATIAELNYTDGVTSNIQTQLDGKAASSHNHAAGNITSGTLSSDRLPTVPVSKGGTGSTNAAGALTNLGLTATATELNYMDGVTSNVQTQLNGKSATSHTHSYLPLSGGTLTGNLYVNGKYIAGEAVTDTSHNHALLIGSSGKDYMNFYEYGGVFNFYKSVSGTDTLLGKITTNGWEGAVKGNASTATKLATAKTINLGTGVTATATNFDGSANITIPVTAISESYLSWGGKNFAGSYGCLDGAMIQDLSANRFSFAKAAGITIEYSRDSGSTWTDYGSSNVAKSSLFTSNGYAHLIGKADSNNKATAAYQLRVTLNAPSAGVYTVLNKFCLYVSTNGSSGTTCTIQIAKNSAPSTYTTIVNEQSVTGWSGYNIINVSGFTFGSNSDQYGNLRFIFKCTGGSTSYNGLQIMSIQGFGGVGWTTPSSMAKTGHLYSFDGSQNATFPATVIAPTLNGTTFSGSGVATVAEVKSYLGI